jgi:hypothetical protein
VLGFYGHHAWCISIPEHAALLKLCLSRLCIPSIPHGANMCLRRGNFTLVCCREHANALVVATCHCEATPQGCTKCHSRLVGSAAIRRGHDTKNWKNARCQGVAAGEGPPLCSHTRHTRCEGYMKVGMHSMVHISQYSFKLFWKWQPPLS